MKVALWDKDYARYRIRTHLQQKVGGVFNLYNIELVCNNLIEDTLDRLYTEMVWPEGILGELFDYKQVFK